MRRDPSAGRIRGPVCNRLQVLAAACLGLGAYIPITSFVQDRTVAFELGSQVVLILPGLLFLVGFAPPNLLTAAWRERDERRLSEAAVGLMGAEEPDDVAGVVVPGVRALMGSPRVVLRSAAGEVMAEDGYEPRGHGAVREVRHRSIGSTELGIVVAPTMPVFGPDEAQHLDRLPLLAELALDRVRLLESERAGRADVERRRPGGRVGVDPAAGGWIGVLVHGPDRAARGPGGRDRGWGGDRARR